jgi:endonuclease G, mitochondrial
MKNLYIIKLILFTLVVPGTYANLSAQGNPMALNGAIVHPSQIGSPAFVNPGKQKKKNKTAIVHLEIPKTLPKDIIITHTGYSLLYNELHEQAMWVAYELTSAETHKVVPRTNKFLPDPLVKTLSADDDDYAGSAYDRGHLASAADMGWSAATMAESFYYSNMSPQVPAFNRGIWKRLEELVRTWAVENTAIYVVTGPVLTSGLSSIGPDKVSVPKYFYKVILDYTDPEIKGIGFLMPNEGSGDPLQNFAVTIDSVERYTGIDFFPALPDAKEKQIESSLCIPCWSWKSTSSSENKTRKENQPSRPGNIQGLSKPVAQEKTENH